MSDILGIDVSVHNGKIDWKRVKSVGIKFAMIRAGYGSHIQNKDACADANFKGALEQGIDVGAYWFSYAMSREDAMQEAQVFLEVIKPYQLAYPACYDFEYDSIRYAKQNGVTITRDLATSFAEAFLNELEKNKYYAANYANLDFITNYYNMNVLSKYDLWYARYASQPGRSDIGMWQYSDSGKVWGCDTVVDQDKALIDYPTIIKRKGLNGFGVTETKKENWAEGAYQYLHDNYGLTLYDTNLDRTVTMAELISILARLRGYKE